PEIERTVLSLYYHEELTLREIAQVVHLHESRISQLKSAAAGPHGRAMAGIPGNGDGMNPIEQNQPLTIATVENARLLLDQWAASLTQVLESMADQKPDVAWQPAA